ncbi:MAG: LuxR C-terminal-related transcriptional regulator, partial [Myxococcota bacterium]
VMGAEDAGESAMSAALQRFCSVYELTEGEVRLLECAMAGMGRPQIAKALGISLHTYQKHATSIKKKTGTSVAQAAVRVLRWCVAGPEV